MLLKPMIDAATTVESVWHALSEELRLFLRSRVPTDADADDLLQDVFLRVYENIGSLRQGNRIESWVYQIARNAVADFYRRRTPRPADAVEDVVDRHGENDGSVNLNGSVAAWLPIMIDVLPQSLRDAVRMFEIEGIAQAEIASRLGISLSGAKSRVQRGRRQLEAILRGSCEFQLDRRGNIIACKPANDNHCVQASCECDGKGP